MVKGPERSYVSKVTPQVMAEPSLKLFFFLAVIPQESVSQVKGLQKISS